MTYQYSRQIENLSVEFLKGTYDWINFRLRIGDRSIQTRFWAYADPLPKLKRWLEAICIGVERCSFGFDAEGDELQFECELDRQGAQFRVKYDYYAADKVLLGGLVDRVQLVREFYLGFLGYRNSPLFNHDGWETEYLWERLVQRLNVERAALEDALLPLSRAELDGLLFDKEPPPHIEIDYISLGGQDPTEKEREYVVSSRADCLIIPPDYDSKPEDFKRGLIHDCLERPWNDCNGSKLAALRSKTVEDFLAQDGRKKK